MPACQAIQNQVNRRLAWEPPGNLSNLTQLPQASHPTLPVEVVIYASAMTHANKIPPEPAARLS